MDRRHFLRALGATGAALVLPNMAFAKANTQQRLLVILQRGAADGLNTVIPYADPSYSTLRKSLAIDVSQAIKLDGMFALHPALKETAKLYSNGQAMLFHAVASPYRERSHFDGQNVLETGGLSPYQLKDGWMNRLLSLLPTPQNNAIAFSASTPMAMRGSMKVSTYAPSRLPEATDDLMLRVSKLYANDESLHIAWESAISTQQMADGSTKNNDAKSMGQLAGSFLAKEDGPRIAMIETGGWDTHNAQEGRLSRQLSALDSMVDALKTALGPTWQNTTVLVCTEFGRTAAVNGTQGTDHGTGAVAMLMGGGINGGRVVADWPGLKPADLYQGRDLNPTLSLDALIASVVSSNYNLEPAKVGKTLFPNSVNFKFINGLYRI
jgi:uncharacterized protein (DUF1501 family)